MTFNYRNTLMAGAVALLAPIAAQAATVTYGTAGGMAGLDIVAGVDNYTDTARLEPTPAGATSPNQVVFNFNIIEALTIPGISVAATGSNNGADLGMVTFDYFAVTGDTFSTIVPSNAPGGLAFGGDFIPSTAIPNPFAVGDSFSLTFNDGIVSNVGITVTFVTEAVASVPVSPVPVPAAGLLLGTALLGGGFAARRRKSQKA